MRDFATLFKEAQFYIEADRRIGGNTLYFWFKDLPPEEQGVLREGTIEMLKPITESLVALGNAFAEWGAKAFENFRLGLENINLEQVARELEE